MVQSKRRIAMNSNNVQQKDHIPEISLFQLIRLIEKNDTELSEITRYNFRCRKCGKNMRYYAPHSNSSRAFRGLAIAGSGLVSLFVIVYLLAAYHESITTAYTLLLFVGLFLLAFGADFLATLILAVRIRNGKFGCFVHVKDENDESLQNKCQTEGSVDI